MFWGDEQGVLIVEERLAVGGEERVRFGEDPACDFRLRAARSGRIELDRIPVIKETQYGRGEDRLVVRR
jgi:hypothetical protein